MPASGERALFRAICEAPWDDGLRLIYADYLDEHEPAQAARAEFIRVQVRLAALPEDAEERPALEKREAALVKAHRRAWQAALPKLKRIKWGSFRLGFVVGARSRSRIAWSPGWSFHRGFVGDVGAETGDAFLVHADALFAATPVEQVSIRKLAPDAMPRLAACPGLARLSGLDLSRNHLGLVATQVLAACPHLTRLRTLSFWMNTVGDMGVRALASSPFLNDLRYLALAYNLIGPEGAEALAGWPALANLEELYLSGNLIRAEGARALMASPYLKKLKTLYVNANHIDNATKKALRGHFGRGVCHA
jgi:uncharacterized protein (TIGR02996 family)